MAQPGLIGHTTSVGEEREAGPRMGRVIEVATASGTGRLWVDLAAGDRAVLVLGHGAGGGVDAPDLVGLASGLPVRGIGVVRFEQPWRVAGRKIAGSPATLDLAWGEAVARVRAITGDLPLFVGGRSAGARVACRGFAAPALGVVALSFPLHPPGKPTSTRVAELARVAERALVIQGDRDPFGTAEEISAALASAGAAAVELVSLPGVAHGLGGRGRAAEQRLPGVVAVIVDRVTEFVVTRL